MTYHNFDDLIDDLTPEQKARVEALKDEARAEMVTYTLGELRRNRELTQTELARLLDRSHAHRWNCPAIPATTTLSGKRCWSWRMQSCMNRR